MIALQILDIKKCMSALLVEPAFNDYSLIEAQITTFCTFSIDGRLEKRFFSDGTGSAKEEDAAAPGRVSYVTWNDVREKCLSVIKGRRTPLFFKLVFFYPAELLEKFIINAGTPLTPDKVSGLCLNFRFDSTGLIATTGTSISVFTPDRSLDHAWDDAVKAMFGRMGIAFSEAT
ncbi:MAG: DUF5721 family protein [Lachnospiraceae bacterium]|nr:DUF5721 family protein [Lachnospiraceae bacterium]